MPPSSRFGGRKKPVISGESTIQTKYSYPDMGLFILRHTYFSVAGHVQWEQTANKTNILLNISFHAPSPRYHLSGSIRFTFSLESFKYLPYIFHKGETELHGAAAAFATFRMTSRSSVGLDSRWCYPPSKCVLLMSFFKSVGRFHTLEPDLATKFAHEGFPA